MTLVRTMIDSSIGFEYLNVANGAIVGAPSASRNDNNGLREESKDISAVLFPRKERAVGVRPSKTFAAWKIELVVGDECSKIQSYTLRQRN